MIMLSQTFLAHGSWKQANGGAAAADEDVEDDPLLDQDFRAGSDDPMIYAAETMKLPPDKIREQIEQLSYSLAVSEDRCARLQAKVKSLATGEAAKQPAAAAAVEPASKRKNTRLGVNPVCMSVADAVEAFDKLASEEELAKKTKTSLVDLGYVPQDDPFPNITAIRAFLRAHEAAPDLVKITKEKNLKPRLLDAVGKVIASGQPLVKNPNPPYGRKSAPRARSSAEPAEDSEGDQPEELARQAIAPARVDPITTVKKGTKRSRAPARRAVPDPDTPSTNPDYFLCEVQSCSAAWLATCSGCAWALCRSHLDTHDCTLWK
jgi:hypothetical protein